MRWRTILITLIITGILSTSILIRPIRGAVLQNLQPVTTAITGVRIAIGDTLYSLWSIGQLRSDRAALQEEVLRLQTELGQMELVTQENESLRKELGIPERDTTTPKQAATTILVSTNPLDRAIIIDVGSRDGVRIGHPVLREGYLIGRVVDTTETTSTVRLITSTKSRIQAWIPSLNSRGLVVGNGIGAVLSEISSSVSVPLGSLVATSGLSLSGTQTVPANIPFGVVGAAGTSERGGAQQFSLDLSIDPSKASTVVVLLTATESELP
jgi:rod shape-determining protein MreC